MYQTIERESPEPHVWCCIVDGYYCSLVERHCFWHVYVLWLGSMVKTWRQSDTRERYTTWRQSVTRRDVRALHDVTSERYTTWRQSVTRRDVRYIPRKVINLNVSGNRKRVTWAPRMVLYSWWILLLCGWKTLFFDMYMSYGWGSTGENVTSERYTTWRQSVTRRDVRYVPRKTRFL